MYQPTGAKSSRFTEPPARTQANAVLLDNYNDLKEAKTYLEKQNNPNNNDELGRNAMKMHELVLKMAEVDLIAKLDSKDLSSEVERTIREELDENRKEQVNHQGRMAKAKAPAKK